MKVRDTNLCEACKEIDYIEHFFFDCKNVKALWKACADQIFKATGEIIKITPMQALFGFNPHMTRSKNNIYINHLMLIAKMVISKFKYGSGYDIIALFENEVRIRKLDKLK